MGAVEEAGEFADEQHGRCAHHYYQPVERLEGLEVEHLTAKGHYQYLAEEYEHGYQQEAAAAFEAQGRVARGKGARVEHVPELHHHECGEEYARLVGPDAVPAGDAVVQQAHKV